MTVLEKVSEYIKDGYSINLTIVNSTNGTTAVYFGLTDTSRIAPELLTATVITCSSTFDAICITTNVRIVI